ncbi:MAG: apolipoprotein N-acyltransferase [Candidatus Hydrogenedentota bacterium]|nr:MAG: apolipoprotein N-acyltransferase [Candidatus Hydrogenedentota bacterium]
MRVRDTIPLAGAGIMLAAAFPRASVWPLAYIGLVPLFLWLQGKNYREAFLGGSLAGLVFYGITFSWFASLTYWAGGVVLLGVGLLVLMFSLFWGGIAVGKCFFDRWMPTGVFAAVPLMWVLMEYVHNHIFTGFGWGSLGYTQWNNLLVAQLASIGSVYAVSFYVVLINVLVCECSRHIRQVKRALPPVAALILLGAGVPVWGKTQMQEPDMTSSLDVGVIQPNFSLDVKWSSEYSGHMFKVQKRLTELVAAKGAELVVWPESALYGYFVDEIDKMADIVRSHDIYLLLGSNHYKDTGPGLEDEILYYNSAFLIDPKGQVLGRYDKRHLAPFGEYVPMEPLFPFLGKIVPQISDFTSGKENKIFEIEENRFPVLICFENSFPHLVRESARLGAGFLVQLTNDGWFGQTAQPRQDVAIAVFRAIENGATLVRGTNTGISCFIDPWGRISGMVHTPWGEVVFARGISVETISTVAHDTFYKTYGDVWVLACGVALVALLGLCLYMRSSKLGTGEKELEEAGGNSHEHSGQAERAQ